MSEQLYDSEPNGVTWAENLDRIGDILVEIRDLLRDHLPERMAEAWTPESMVDDYTERPWSDDVRAADVVNDQDAEIARLREEVERRTEAQALAEALVLNHEAVIERLTRKWDEARQLAWKTADAATRAEKAESRERKLMWNSVQSETQHWRDKLRYHRIR